MNAFKVSLSGGKKSGSYEIYNIAEARLFYTTLNSSSRDSIPPPLPKHELMLPAGGHLEDFILGDLGTPYISERTQNILEKAVPGGYEYLPLEVLNGELYYILLIRPGILCLDMEKSKLSEFSVDLHAFDASVIEGEVLFRIKGYPGTLYGTTRFAEIVMENKLTGVYLREPDVLLPKGVMPFRLPLLKRGSKAIMRG